MAEKSLNMEMGNLVCRFGDHKVLLDLAEEVVLPSFLDKRLIRAYDTTSYFFHDVSLVSLSKTENVIGIVGRFIKDTTLEREQIFEQGKGLVRDIESMRSSPSSLFLLILNNHRLIYVRETRDAPPKESFRSTLLSFLRVKHKQFIGTEYERANSKLEDGENTIKVTKTELYEQYPRPTLELIPLTSGESIAQFLKKYKTLKTIEISLSDRNDESDNEPFFEELQKRKDALGSTNSVVRHSNSTDGLDVTKAATEIEEATAQGNQRVKLNGVDSDGDTLRGNNEEFQLRKPLNNLSRNPKKAATQLYESFVGLVDEGLVRLPPTSRKAMATIGSLISTLF